MILIAPGLRQLNRERIRRWIRNHNMWTKAQIARWTSLSVSTCNTVLTDMLESGEILLANSGESHVGRQAARYRYNPDYQHALAIHLDCVRRVMVTTIVNALGDIISVEHIPFTEPTVDDLVVQIQDHIDSDPRISGLSLAVPGIVRDGVVDSCFFGDLVGVDLKKEMRDRVGIDPTVGGDIHFAAAGACPPGADPSAMYVALDLPTGGKWYPSGGVARHGEILAGDTGFRGQLGYLVEGLGISDLTGVERTNRLVLAVITLLNPSHIVLFGHEVDERLARDVRAYCEKLLPDNHLPTIIADADFDECCTRGLVQNMLNDMFFEAMNDVKSMTEALGG